ncbi:hypothetical protein [Tahibacter amnicola]|uniref:START domain-containing protein n=1 Tax=Tahibacter amnicola TaxID=2976241 RepID=A0ABY6BCG3_9GAMM|nr:hypothetical protein [Tahibacter amnicola]UXI66010.1 hypothetical protein N4264_14750 [Tahibacter amnicola]
MSHVSNTTTTDKAAVPRKIKAPLWKRLYFAFSLLVMAVLAAHIAWVASGTGQWKLAKDADGIQVYLLKAPGDALLKAKTVMEGDYTLTQLASQHLIVGDTLENCIKWIPGCKDMKRIQDFDPVRGYDKDMWRVDLPGPFADRELLIATMFEQNKQTKEVVLDVVSLPNTLPHTPGVVRIERMHNRWTYTPKPNGKVEVSLIQDVDLPGIGFFPYILLNMTLVDHSHKFFATTLRETLKEERYVNAKLDFIDDIRQPESAVTSTH